MRIFRSWKAASVATVMVFTSWAPRATAQEDRQKELARSLVASARKVYELTLTRYKYGTGKLDFDEQNRWSRRWLEAELDLADTKEKRIAAYEEHLKRMRTWEDAAKKMLKGSQISPIEMAMCEYFRAQAELWLERAKKDQGK